MTDTDLPSTYQPSGESTQQPTGARGWASRVRKTAQLQKQQSAAEHSPYDYPLVPNRFNVEEAPLSGLEGDDHQELLDRVATSLLASGRMMGVLVGLEHMRAAADAADAAEADDLLRWSLDALSQPYPLTNLHAFVQRFNVTNPLQSQHVHQVLRPRADFALSENPGEEADFFFLACPVYISGSIKAENVHHHAAKIAARHERAAAALAGSLAMKAADGVSNLTRLIDYHVETVLKARATDYYLVRGALEKASKSLLFPEETYVRPERIRENRLRMIPKNLLSIAKGLDWAKDGPSPSPIQRPLGLKTPDDLLAQVEGWQAENADALNSTESSWQRSRERMEAFCAAYLRYAIPQDYAEDLAQRLTSLGRADLVSSLFPLPVAASALRVMAEKYLSQFQK